MPLTLDLERQQRCGFAEVIYGPGKSDEVLIRAAAGLVAAGQDVLATRLTDRQLDLLSRAWPEGHADATARTWRRMHGSPLPDRRLAPVAVVTAGTGDGPVAAEVRETLRWMRVPVRQVDDVGVAGPHRLVERLDVLVDCAAIVVVAGMEGALPSVVAGHVRCPVIGVPTSVGYGANFGGLSALLSMLNSCAANVTVVNIDAGFKGGFVAGLIATSGRRSESSDPASVTRDAS
ncbi:MAG TPA: nickel pincer cofactor biosynthesis protein LarB [Pirellulaceae bacterium]|nr:nickel pincer cofactor biosynthesis protein LarB [Pirellulaceae bacterium]